MLQIPFKLLQIHPLLSSTMFGIAGLVSQGTRRHADPRVVVLGNVHRVDEVD